MEQDRGRAARREVPEVQGELPDLDPAAGVAQDRNANFPVPLWHVLRAPEGLSSGIGPQEVGPEPIRSNGFCSGDRPW